MATLQQGSTFTRSFFMVRNTDHLTFASGLSPVVQLSKGGGTFATAAGTVLEIGQGWYSITLTNNDTSTIGELAYHITATGADDTDFVDEVTASGQPTASTASGTTSQVRTYSDLYQDLQNRVRVTSGVVATQTQAKRYINIALQDMALGTDYKCPWLERHDFIVTRAPYTTGTVSINQGSTVLTGVGTNWTQLDSFGIPNARYPGKLTIAGALEVYEVALQAGVLSDTAINLRQKYIPTSAPTGSSYIYFEDEYALPADFLRPIDYQLFSPSLNIMLVGRQEFRYRYPRRNIQGRPRIAHIIDDRFQGSTTPVRRVVFYPFPDTVYMIPFSYITSSLAVTATGVESNTLVGDTDEPTMPLRYRHAIVMHALYNWYRDRKDDTRSAEAKAEYTDLMMRMVNDQEIGAPTRARVVPRTGMYTGYARHPYIRRGGRTISINNSFDRFEDGSTP